MTQLARPTFLLKFQTQALAHAWLSGVLTCIGVHGGSDKGLLGFKIGKTVGIDVDLNDYEEGDFVSAAPSEKLIPDALVVEACLLLNVDDDGEAADWINETFREMQVNWNPASSLVDYENCNIQETDARVMSDVLALEI